MEHYIHLKDENVRIVIDSEETLSKTHNISVVGAIQKCIKGVYRYGEFTMSKNIMIRILFLALRGKGCKEDHLDISQRVALYHHFDKEEVINPYIQQFLKDTKENFGNAII